MLKAETSWNLRRVIMKNRLRILLSAWMMLMLVAGTVCPAVHADADMRRSQ